MEGTPRSISFPKDFEPNRLPDYAAFAGEDELSENGEQESVVSSENQECNCKPILVTDDNEFNLFTFSQLLLQFNLESDGAENGQVAVDMVKKSLQCCPYKAIFMDCFMPIMDGYAATGKLLEVFKENYESLQAQGL